MYANLFFALFVASLLGFDTDHITDGILELFKMGNKSLENNENIN